MRRIKWLAAMGLALALIIAGCGTKDAESVVKDLNDVVTDMDSYKGKGTMTLNTGQQPLQYQVEVWYQQPAYYRILLTNTQKDITQIVLRNDDGVFVLTPRLNKSFRFQSDWPEKQGQVYLYQTLVQSILLDNSRQFVSDENAYVFDVMANYQNGALARQKIWLSKENYAPQQVQVSDANATVMVEVKFDTFEFGTAFEKDAFDMQKNMANAPMPGGEQSSAAPAPAPIADPTDDGADTTSSDELAGPGDAGAGDSTDGSGSGDAAEQQETPVEDSMSDPTMSEGVTEPQFIAMEPLYLPDGVALKDWSEITFAGNPGVMLRYSGTYDYTLIQTRPKDRATALATGNLIDLGHTMGLMSGEEQRTLTWTYEGVEYRLSSATLPEQEMIKVAQSVEGEMGK